MAPNILYAQPSQNFNLNPTILPPSQGDLEEGRIRRATDLARLTNLQQAPWLEQRKLALSQAAQDEVAKYHEGELNLTARGQDVQQRGQDTTYAAETRGQDMHQTESQNAIKAALTQHILTLAHTYTDFHLDDLADVAKQNGLPELQNTLTSAQNKHIEAAAPAALQKLDALKGDPNGFQTMLSTIKSDKLGPGLLKKVQDTAPDYLKPMLSTKDTTQSEMQSTGESPLGSKLAYATKTLPFANPLTAPAAIAGLIGYQAWKNRNDAIPAIKRTGSDFLKGF